MTTSFTTTSTFTRTNAIYLASKIAADLAQMQQFYGSPSNELIQKYIEEIVILMVGGYLDRIEYGFKKNGKWIAGAALSYQSKWNGLFSDDSPGRVLSRAEISGAIWSSFLVKNSKFSNLSSNEQQKIEMLLPINRTIGSEPQSDGIWVSDKSYSSGGVAMQRRILKSY